MNEPQISKVNQNMNEPQIPKEPQISKENQIMNEPQILK